jgi:hypothetical protein
LTTDPTALREEISSLLSQLEKGDLPRRRFDLLFTERTVDLCREVARRALPAGESVLAEHHFAHAHLRQSVLAEPEEVAVSLFLSEQRLMYVRLRVVPGRPVTCDQRDGTDVVDIPLASITGLSRRRVIRRSEIVAGAVIAALAWGFRDYLQVTGVVLVGLGLAGMLHGLAWPTTWIEVRTSAGAGDAGLSIYALHRKSGRRLLQLLRRCTTAAS